MNGTFNISLNTPMGLKSGTIILIDNNGVLSGSLRALGKENPIVRGIANGNTFEIEGFVKTGFGKIEYSANGTIIKDILEANAKTKFGIMKISGTRVKN